MLDRRSKLKLRYSPLALLVSECDCHPVSYKNTWVCPMSLRGRKWLIKPFSKASIIVMTKEAIALKRLVLYYIMSLGSPTSESRTG